ncbi:MAG: AMP-binding protein [Proteobacteria bacterium]|nr:AMP-binding protein [Pseudomonadota bacterium]
MDAAQLEKELDQLGLAPHRLEAWAESRPDKVFFLYGEDDRSLTYSEFNRLANQVARNLRAMGLEKGDRVSLFLLNPLVISLAMFGLWKIGAVFCPINFNYTARLLSYQINDTRPRLLITESGREPILNRIAEELPALPVIVHRPRRDEHDYSPENESLELDPRFPVSLFADLLSGDDSNPGVPLEYFDTASIIYTSGTTGPAKGVVQSYRWMQNYCYYSVKLQHPDDVVYNDLPLYHVGGAFANVARAAWGGCTTAVWDRFSPSEFWTRIRQSGATMAILLDVMMPWLLIPEATSEDRNNPLRQVHMQPLPEYHHMFARRFGIDVVTCGYGQTEAGMGFVGVLDEFPDGDGTPPELYKGHPKEALRRMVAEMGIPIIDGRTKIKKGFMGLPSVMLEPAVLDERDEEVGPNQHGELAFRGRLPYLLLNEYFNKPEATAGVFRNLWFHTGDGVYRGDDGYTYFVDRVGGFIRTRGENISSYQIEDIVNGHPKVGVSAAFPIPSDQGEEDDVVTYVVPAPGQTLTEEELRDWLKTEMPRFMWPRYIRFIEALPQTPTYKVEKYKLKQMILKELNRA